MSTLDLIRFITSPLVWFIIGWYSSRSNTEKGPKAGFITGFKIFMGFLAFELSLIGIYYLSMNN